MKALRKAIIIGAISIAAIVAVAKNVGVAWDASPSVVDFPNLSYNVYVYTNGAASATTNGAFAVYSTTNTGLVISNLNVGTTYWANVDAEDTNGLHSDLSATVSFVFPSAPMSLHIAP